MQMEFSIHKFESFSSIRSSSQTKTKRATRLGEFSPIGRLLLWEAFCNITEEAQKFVLLFFLEKSYVLILTKK
jgi:hypothetical protein